MTETNANGYIFVYQDWNILKNTIDTNSEERLDICPKHLLQFSQMMQDARIEKKMSIHDLSNRTGISIKQLTLYETGSEQPSVQDRNTIFENLNIKSAP